MCNERYNILDDIDNLEVMLNSWNTLFTNLKCSPRDIDRILKNTKLLIDTSLYSSGLEIDVIVIEFYTFMLIMKYKFRNKYKMILKERFLSSTDSGNGTYKVLEDIFYGPTYTIKNAMELLENNGNDMPVKEDDSFYYEPVKSRRNRIKNINRGEYIERKLELFEYTDLEY